MYKLNKCVVDGNPFELNSLSENDIAIVAGIHTANVLCNAIKNLKKEKIVLVDVGGNVGSSAIPLAVLFRGRITIHVVEPHPVIYDILLENIKKYNLEGCVIPHKLAIGSTKNFIGDAVHKENTGLCQTSNQQTPNSLKVECMDLNTFLISNNIPHVDILKCDVEGAEFDIFHEFTQWDMITKYYIEIHAISDVGIPREMVDEHLGVVVGFQKFIMRKLQVNFSSKHLRLLAW